jgi:ribonuclease E
MASPQRQAGSASPAERPASREERRSAGPEQQQQRPQSREAQPRGAGSAAEQQQRPGSRGERRSILERLSFSGAEQGGSAAQRPGRQQEQQRLAPKVLTIPRSAASPAPAPKAAAAAAANAPVAKPQRGRAALSPEPVLPEQPGEGVEEGLNEAGSRRKRRTRGGKGRRKGRRRAGDGKECGAGGEDSEGEAEEDLGAPPGALGHLNSMGRRRSATAVMVEQAFDDDEAMSGAGAGALAGGKLACLSAAVRSAPCLGRPGLRTFC